VQRPLKITFGEMRESGVRSVLIYCTDYRCSHYIQMSADHRPDDLRASDIEQRFVCTVCGGRGANFCPNFSEGKKVAGILMFEWSISDQNSHLILY
jgi:hypothetical protein